MTTSKKNSTAIHLQKNANNKPNWDVEKLRSERPLWQVAALAGDISPTLKIVKAEREVNPEWSRGYRKMIELLTNALDPRRSEGKVFYDSQIPINMTRVNTKSDLRNVRVDVASAIAFLVMKYGVEHIPAGLLKMHEHLRSQTPLERASSLTGTAHKSRARAATTKIQTLTKLLYAVVESEYGWASSDGTSQTGTLKRIATSLDRLELGSSRYGLGSDSIEEILHAASEKYPVRKELQPKV